MMLHDQHCIANSMNSQSIQSIANSMNEYFCSVGDKLSRKIPDEENTLLKGDHDINPTAARCTFSSMQHLELLKAMNNFKT